MGLFSRKKTPEQIGAELAGRLKEFVATLPEMLSSIQDGKMFTLDEIDRRRLIREATILTYVGQRLALQLVHKTGVKRDMETRQRICKALDSSASAFLDRSSEFNDLIDQRGEQYFQLLQNNSPHLGSGDCEAFLAALQFEFEQFCRAGDHQDNDVVVIGGFRSMMPLNILAAECWLAGFTETARHIDGHVD